MFFGIFHSLQVCAKYVNPVRNNDYNSNIWYNQYHVNISKTAIFVRIALALYSIHLNVLWFQAFLVLTVMLLYVQDSCHLVGGSKFYKMDGPSANGSTPSPTEKHDHMKPIESDDEGKFFFMTPNDHDVRKSPVW